MLDRIIFQAGTMGLIKEFLRTDILGGSTINYVRPPMLGPFTFPLAMLGLATVVFVIIFLYSRRTQPRPATRVLLYSFVVTTLIFTLRMDLNWLHMLGSDIRNFHGRDVSVRFAAIDGNDLYRFMNFVKKSLPPGGKVRVLDIDQSEPGHYSYKLGNYYLLPVLSSTKGRFIWVHGVLKASYNAETMELKVYTNTFRARPYAVYDRSAGIFEIMEDGL